MERPWSSLNESRHCWLPTQDVCPSAFLLCSPASGLSPAGDKTGGLSKLILVLPSPGQVWWAFHFVLAGRTECLVELLMRKCCFSDESWWARANGHFLPVNPLRWEEAVQAATAILALGGGPRPSAAAEDAEQKTWGTQPHSCGRPARSFLCRETRIVQRQCSSSGASDGSDWVGCGF